MEASLDDAWDNVAFLGVPGKKGIDLEAQAADLLLKVEGERALFLPEDGLDNEMPLSFSFLLLPAECVVLLRLTSVVVPKSFALSAGFRQLMALKDRGLRGLQDAASPDKVAALLLLAKNECVGVSSLLTMLLSQGLSCRRRALSGEFSNVADEEESRLLMTGSTCFERFIVETDRLSGSVLLMLLLV